MSDAPRVVLKAHGRTLVDLDVRALIQHLLYTNQMSISGDGVFVEVHTSVWCESIPLVDPELANEDE